MRHVFLLCHGAFLVLFSLAWFFYGIIKNLVPFFGCKFFSVAPTNYCLSVFCSWGFFMFYFYVILVIAFLINIPLGYIRTPCEKFSFRWFLYIHLSIPLLIWMRVHFGVGFTIIPFEIVLAVLGQFAGGYIYKRRLADS